LPEELDHRVDQHREILGAVARHLGDPLLGNPKDNDPVRLVHLGAAMPVPPASSIVSTMSATSRPTQGAVGSSTAAEMARNTGCPMRAIFKSAMAAICGAGRVG